MNSPRRFFGHSPPPHATLSATLRLPLDRPDPPPGGGAELRHALRDLRFHPEAHLAQSGEEARRLVAEKREAVATIKTPLNAAARHQRIERANLAMQPLLKEQRAALVSEQSASALRQQAAAVLGSREYSFCLFPEAFLRKR